MGSKRDRCNKILLSDESSKVLLDFGQNFEKENNFFHYPFLAPREEKHLISLNILPAIPGIYKKDPTEKSIQGVIVPTHIQTIPTTFVI